MTNQLSNPSDIRFAFHVDFEKGVSPASRVFCATYEFIEACERLDRGLVSSIDAGIETSILLEDIEPGSIKTWLRVVLTSIDDQALKSLDWKPLVGKFLVRAKHRILKWTNEDGEKPRKLQDLGDDIRKLAAETDVRHIPDYPRAKPGVLMDAIGDFEAVKDHLSPGDKASLITPFDGEVEMNLKSSLSAEDIEALAVQEKKTHSISSVPLTVKKPDYLASSMWEFHLDGRTVSVKIEDGEWLRKFQNRRIEVLPGDALRCRIRLELFYGYDNELIGEKRYVEKVHAVEKGQHPRQSSLPYS